MTTDRDKGATIVVSVKNIADREQMIKRIYANLTTEPSTTFTVLQDQVNRIRIYHNVGPEIRVLIRTYLVIVIPIIIDLNPIDSLYGILDFHLDETILQLQTIIDKLRKLQGRHIRKGGYNGETLKRLVEGLRGSDDKY